MTASKFVVTSAALTGLMVIGAPAVSSAQRATGLPPSVGRLASIDAGSILGIVKDEAGAPVPGAMVSAVGATTAVAFSDREGRFELLELPPGPYLVRTFLKGFQAPRPTIVAVRASGAAASSIALRRTGSAPAILTAGVGGLDVPDLLEQPGPEEGDLPDSAAEAVPGEEGETLWRLRHARRGVLKSADAIGDLLSQGEPDGPDLFGSADLFGRAVAVPARIATAFFAETPFSGEINFLTAGSFERPEQLLSSDWFPRGTGIAHVSVGAPVGEQADWTVSGALTQADLSSWIVAGSYVSRPSVAHRYDVGLSYSAQRYHGGNPLALRGVADVTRNASAVHGFGTFSVSPALSVTYGGRYARYDYLERRGLLSPRVEMLFVPIEGLRVGVALSRSAHAPGAEEFLPPGDTGIWLPPQRTFSSLEPDRSLAAERVTQLAVELERDVAGSTLAVRAFRQRVTGQLVTLFGADSPDQPVATLGHYFVGNAGDVDATGGEAELRATWAGRVQGSVSYRLTRAEFDPAADLRYVLLLAPGPLRPEVERIHDVATTIKADVPETATRVLVVYRASNAFAGPGAPGDGVEGGRSGLDYRFDVQVRQGLPFMSFSNAKWEMLLAVRNFFRETADDQSVYGELLVIRPPKQIVGGVSLHF